MNEPKELTGSDVDALVADLKDCPESVSFGHYGVIAKRLAPDYSPAVVVMSLVYSYGYGSYPEFSASVPFSALAEMIPKMVEKNKDFFSNLLPVKEEPLPVMATQTLKSGKQDGLGASAA